MISMILIYLTTIFLVNTMRSSIALKLISYVYFTDISDKRGRNSEKNEITAAILISNPVKLRSFKAANVFKHSVIYFMCPMGTCLRFENVSFQATTNSTIENLLLIISPRSTTLALLILPV